MLPFDEEIIRVYAYQAAALYIVGLIIAIITVVFAIRISTNISKNKKKKRSTNDSFTRFIICYVY